MANIKSNKKSLRQDQRRRMYNRHFKSSVKTSLKRVDEAMENKDNEKLESSIKVAHKMLDRAENKNVYHKNKVSREKRRLASLSLEGKE